MPLKRRVLPALALITVVGTAACAAEDQSGVPRRHSVRLAVSGVGTAAVGYLKAGTPVDAVDVSLPWSKEFEAEGDDFRVTVSVTQLAKFNGGQVPICSIYVDGRQLQEMSGTEYGVSCDRTFG